MKLFIIAVFIALACIYVGFNFTDNFNPELIKGKNVIITGASAGIGEQLAYHYAQFGANIVITARRQEQLEKVLKRCKELGPSEARYFYILLDMSEKDSPRKLVEFAEKSLGSIDYVVLNHVLNIDMTEWLGTSQNLTLLRKAMDINFFAYVTIASHALESLKKSNGSIIVLSSLTGKVPQPKVVSYSSSKFALEGFFGGLREDLRMLKVNVSVTICTIGLVNTENVMNNLRKSGTKVFTAVVPADPSDTALAVIKGGTQRHARIYYPHMRTLLITTAYHFMPETISSLMRSAWEKVEEQP